MRSFSNAFRKRGIAFKLIISVLLVALVGAAGLTATAVRIAAVEAEYVVLVARDGRASTASARLNQLSFDLERRLYLAIVAADAELSTRLLNGIPQLETEAQAQAALVRPAVEGTPLAAALAAVEQQQAAQRSLATNALRLLRDGKAEEARRMVLEDFRPKANDLRTANRALTDAVIAQAQSRADALAAQTGAATRATLWLVGAGMLAGLLLAVWMIRAAVLRPFGRLDGAMRRLTEGDYATPVADTDRTDEIGRMATGLGGFAVSLQEAQALREQQEAQKQRAEQDRRATLAGTADMLEAGVREVSEGIASAATELNASATAMVDIAEGTSARATTVGAETAAATAEVNTVAAATEELAASVNEISRQIANSARMAASAVEQSQRTNATVATLTEASERISEVTRLIGEIAGQTNLLALNATIEAARAGDAGKGFAVVASEVKALASQTAQATVNIGQQIEAMQAATRDATADVVAIRDNIAQINEMTTAIAAAVEQQGMATRDIAESVQRAASGTSRIGEAIQGVSESATETGGAASQVRATSTTLAGQAETLCRAVGDVLHRLRAA